MIDLCRKCNADLIVGVNWKPSSAKRNDRICNVCRKPQKAKEVLAIKEKTIVEYGGKCVCCGETTQVFLTIDHIGEDGADERRQINRGAGYNFYYWLKKQGYPKENYQILCFNCNFAKHTLGICPHQVNND
jgi:hypothetical protein